MIDISEEFRVKVTFTHPTDVKAGALTLHFSNRKDWEAWAPVMHQIGSLIHRITLEANGE